MPKINFLEEDIKVNSIKGNKKNKIPMIIIISLILLFDVIGIISTIIYVIKLF